jgi:hypothetical protein
MLKSEVKRERKQQETDNLEQRTLNIELRSEEGTDTAGIGERRASNLELRRRRFAACGFAERFGTDETHA